MRNAVTFYESLRRPWWRHTTRCPRLFLSLLRELALLAFCTLEEATEVNSLPRLLVSA